MHHIKNGKNKCTYKTGYQLPIEESLKLKCSISICIIEIAKAAAATVADVKQIHSECHVHQMPHQNNNNNNFQCNRSLNK